jgi:peroxiredoxin
MKTRFARLSIASLAGAALVASLAGASAFAVEPPASKPTSPPVTKPAPTQPEKTIKEAGKDGTEHVKKQAHDAADKTADKAKEAIVQGKAELTKSAPTFTLTDTAGNTVSLATVLSDKKNIVVLEWFNPDCPFVKKHHDKHDTFKAMAKKYSDKPVKFFAINSGGEGKQGFGLERNQKAKTDYGIEYPILLDPTGVVGKAYGAKTTPHMYVINKDGILAYRGAIDDNDSADTAGKTNYVTKAVDELLAGGSVTKSETTAYGCSVKFK